MLLFYKDLDSSVVEGELLDFKEAGQTRLKKRKITSVEFCPIYHMPYNLFLKWNKLRMLFEKMCGNFRLFAENVIYLFTEVEGFTLIFLNDWKKYMLRMSNYVQWVGLFVQ